MSVYFSVLDFTIAVSLFRPPIPTVDEDHRNELVKEEPEKEENHYNGRVDFEDAFAQALTKSILEQAAARKARKLLF